MLCEPRDTLGVASFHSGIIRPPVLGVDRDSIAHEDDRSAILDLQHDRCQIVVAIVVTRDAEPTNHAYPVDTHRIHG